MGLFARAKRSSELSLLSGSFGFALLEKESLVSRGGPCGGRPRFACLCSGGQSGNTCFRSSSLHGHRNVELVEELAEEPVAMAGRKATGGAANLHAGGQSDERAASRTRARAWKDWASTTAMADGARWAQR